MTKRQKIHFYLPLILNIRVELVPSYNLLQQNIFVLILAAHQPSLNVVPLNLTNIIAHRTLIINLNILIFLNILP